MCAGTDIPNFKKIGSKLWPRQGTCVSDQDGGRDVINYDNEFKREQLHLQTLGHCVFKVSFL